jgi:hypothetical protein
MIRRVSARIEETRPDVEMDCPLCRPIVIGPPREPGTTIRIRELVFLGNRPSNSIARKRILLYFANWNGWPAVGSCVSRSGK